MSPAGAQMQVRTHHGPATPGHLPAHRQPSDAREHAGPRRLQVSPRIAARRRSMRASPEWLTRPDAALSEIAARAARRPAGIEHPAPSHSAAPRLEQPPPHPPGQDGTEQVCLLDLLQAPGDLSALGCAATPLQPSMSGLIEIEDDERRPHPCALHVPLRRSSFITIPVVHQHLCSHSRCSGRSAGGECARAWCRRRGPWDVSCAWPGDGVRG